MARELKPCGTPAAARRHRRRGEPVDEPCRQASRDEGTARTARRQEASARAVQLALVRIRGTESRPPLPPADAPLDELAEARENLELVTAAMVASPPASMASLSKRRQELVTLICELQAKEEKRRKPGASVLDQLAARRAQRLADAKDLEC
ncbi:hypothetical protein [Arthrobacter sp. S39]|uniref:hypothetical protein n=1 Tax=Arthrobacter sp. S39 TaxID=2509720 RepID=UPI0010382A35|nr:hypothetical protein [Arthrobacter sp. S39]TAP45628.1 hypothetical protein EYS21_02615 [Arthrobacter sp. S39]